MLDAINAARGRHGAPPLVWDRKVSSYNLSVNLSFVSFVKVKEPFYCIYFSPFFAQLNIEGHHWAKELARNCLAKVRSYHTNNTVECQTMASGHIGNKKEGRRKGS